MTAGPVAQQDSPAERTATATMTREMAELARVGSAISAGASATALEPALANGKTTMNTLSPGPGPAAVTAVERANITRMESVINAASIAGLALGLLAGLAGVALFASGISRRATKPLDLTELSRLLDSVATGRHPAGAASRRAPAP